ncbi:DUF3114 domain-containing protein [Latilactobacillus fuchuensis]|uniref:DUF3114 domain-containing protein n=1 Tax=Latilactobacillus fuchuensis TaxID=164393 RepID=UPI0039B09A7E
MRQKIRELTILQSELISLLQPPAQQPMAGLEELLAIVRGQLLLAYDQDNYLTLSTDQRNTLQIGIIQALSQQPAGVKKLQLIWQQTTASRYQIQNEPQLVAHFNQLEQANWDLASLRAYAKYIKQRPLTAQQYRKNNSELHRIGSPLYTRLYQAYGRQTTNRVINWQKANLVLNQLEAQLDSHQFLQLRSRQFRIDPAMPPDALFLTLFAKSVQLAFRQRLLTNQRLHQFRLYLDRQNEQYMRRFWQKNGQTDEQALAQFVANRQQANPQYWLRREPARFHNKYRIGQPMPNDFPNRKRLTPDFHSEWLIDEHGQFISQWSVLKQSADELVISNPDDYQLTDAQCRQLLNGASFNYAHQNDQTHVQLDSWPPKRYDHLLRQETFNAWRSPSKAIYQNKDIEPDGYSVHY